VCRTGNVSNARVDRPPEEGGAAPFESGIVGKLKGSGKCQGCRQGRYAALRPGGRGGGERSSEFTESKQSEFTESKQSEFTGSKQFTESEITTNSTRFTDSKLSEVPKSTQFTESAVPHSKLDVSGSNQLARSNFAEISRQKVEEFQEKGESGAGV
jgi:hypothetical protein